MSGILTPGYLRWDGTKYVLDHDIEIVGPPGSAGPAGPIGPVGPVGPGGTGSGDLLGNYPGPMSVVGLTGISGVVSFGPAITNPTITQTATASTNGQFLTLRAQAAALFGGNVVLQSGTGSTNGLIQFLIGNTQVGQFDNNNRLLIGPGNASTFNIFGSTPVPSATNFLFSNSATGRNVSGTYSGAANDFASNEVLNYSAGSAATTGVRMVAAGGSFGTVGAWDSNGVIDQIGSATSALVHTATLGSTGVTTTLGRTFQSGAFAFGDRGNNNSSAGAQAGLTGAVLNIGQITGGSIATQSGQTVIYSSITPFVASFPPNGALFLQGDQAVALEVGTSVIAGVSPTKFINNKGQTYHVTNTTTNPYNVLTSDYIVSLGTFTTASTTIAGGSNGQSLPGTGNIINVASTTSFPTSGALLILATQTGGFLSFQTVFYTGTSGGTQFTGTSGGTGTINTGNTVIGLFTVNLPTSPNTGDTYIIKDSQGSAAASNILVNGNGVNIDGGFANIIIMTNFTQASFTYNGTIWVSSLTTNVAPNSGYTSVVNVPSGGTASVVGFDQALLCDPTTAGCTIVTPNTPQNNLRFTVKDATFQASATHPITVNGNGKVLENPASPGTYASPISITTAGQSATWAYDPFRVRYTLVATAL